MTDKIISDPTYIFLNQSFRPPNVFQAGNITLVEAHMLKRLALLLRHANVKHSDTDASHPIHLRQDFAQARRPARDDHDLSLPDELARGAPGQPLVYLAQKSQERDEHRVQTCVLEVRVRGRIGEGAQAEGDQPGDVGVEDGAG